MNGNTNKGLAMWNYVVAYVLIILPVLFILVQLVANLSSWSRESSIGQNCFFC